MKEYSYRAIDVKGKKVLGIQEANGLDDLEYRLSNQGFHFVSAKIKKQGITFFEKRKITRRQLIVLFIYLEQMAGAGIPIIETFVEMRDNEESASMRQVLSSLVDNISSGQPLSKAMSEQPKIFTELMVNLVKAGEETGNMANIFGELKDILVWQDGMIKKTKKLISYPLFVGSIVFCVVCFLMIYLVPQLVSFILSMGQEIPVMTRALIFVSNIFVNYWFLILLLPVMLFITLKFTLKRNASARYVFDRYKLEMPLFGDAVKKLILSRFCKSFSLLYDAGVDVIDCLEISGRVVVNVYMEKELDAIKNKVSTGDSLYDAFSSAQLFPPLVLRMLHVGEQTGGLGHSLLKISDFYSTDVTNLIEKIQLMIEPAMTVIMGILLGWIMIAVLGPIYDIISSIQL